MDAVTNNYIDDHDDYNEDECEDTDDDDDDVNAAASGDNNNNNDKTNYDVDDMIIMTVIYADQEPDKVLYSNGGLYLKSLPDEMQ